MTSSIATIADVLSTFWAIDACVVEYTMLSNAGRMGPPAPWALRFGVGIGIHMYEWLLNTPPSEILLRG
jgi:hypothetical protein